MIVQKPSVFPAAKETIFRKLQQLETLHYIAKPYAAFEPIGKAVSTWAVGSTSAYRFRIFGVIPYGTHTIHILRFDPDGVSSREGNEHVPVWNHDIRLIEKDENHKKPQYRYLLNYREGVYDKIPVGLTDDKLYLELYKQEQEWKYDIARKKSEMGFDLQKYVP